MTFQDVLHVSCTASSGIFAMSERARQGSPDYNPESLRSRANTRYRVR